MADLVGSSISCVCARVYLRERERERMGKGQAKKRNKEEPEICWLGKLATSTGALQCICTSSDG